MKVVTCCKNKKLTRSLVHFARNDYEVKAIFLIITISRVSAKECWLCESKHGS